MNRSTTWTAALLIAVTVSACNPSSQATDASNEPETETPATNGAFAEAPEGTEAIAGLLGARHTEDLPNADTLAAHPGAEASLHWLATHGEGLAVRTRAASSLRFYDSEATVELLVGLLAEPATHPALRAAAITGTGGLELETREKLRAMIDTARASEDRRVQEAAQNRLADELAAP